MRNRSVGVALSYGRILVNLVCGLLLSAVLLRVLGDAEYGVYQTVAAFANYLVLLEFGMGTVMVRNLSACRGAGASPAEMQRQVSTLWTLAVCLGGVILAAAAVFYCLIPAVYAASMTATQIAHGQQMFGVLTGVVVLSFLAQTVSGVLLAFEHYRFAAIEGTIRTALRAAVILAAVHWQKNAMVIAIADLIFSGLSLAAMAIYFRRKTELKLRLGKPDGKILRAALPLAMAIFLQAIVNQANNNVDKFLIGVLLTPEAVALYSVALYIYSVFSALTTVPISLYGPKIQQCVEQSGDLMAQLVPPCRLTAVMGGAVLFGFAALGRPFIRLVYGESYLQAWTIALLLMGPMYLNAVTGPAVNGLDAKNKRMGRSWILLLTTALNVVLTVFWLRQWGVLGAAAATAVATVLGQVVLGNWYYRKALGIPVGKLYRQAFQGIWLWLILSCLAGAMVAHWMPHDLAALLCGGCVFMACLLPVVWQSKVYKKSERL